MKLKLLYLVSLVFALGCGMPLSGHSQKRVPQEHQRPWALDATLLGPAGLYSVGVYRNVPGLSCKWGTTSLGASANVFHYKQHNGTEFVVLPEINFLFFPRISHHAEIGLLARVEYEHNWDHIGPLSHWFIYPTFRLGYRFERPNGRMYIRTGASPFFQEGVEEGALIVLPYLGFGLRL